jgi:hypothetical protein
VGYEIQWGDMGPEVGMREGLDAAENSSFIAKIMIDRFKRNLWLSQRRSI